MSAEYPVLRLSKTTRHQKHNLQKNNLTLDFNKIKTFFSVKGTKNQKQATDWEKFANHIPDKGVVSRRYKEHSNLNNIKTN